MEKVIMNIKEEVRRIIYEVKEEIESEFPRPSQASTLEDSSSQKNRSTVIEFSKPSYFTDISVEEAKNAFIFRANSLIDNTLIRMQENFDNEIVEVIIKEAEKHDFSRLVLLDKKFILDALKEKEQREIEHEWITYQHFSGRAGSYGKCPVCENIPNLKTNFCDNCGAKMRNKFPQIEFSINGTPCEKCGYSQNLYGDGPEKIIAECHSPISCKDFDRLWKE